MSELEDIYKLKYLKYKKKYLDLQSKVGAGFPAAAIVKRQQDDARRQRQKKEKEDREAKAKAYKLEEEARFNALPQEEKNRILQERKAAEEKRQAEIAEEAKRAEERLKLKRESDNKKAEPLIKKINELHGNTLNAQCGFSGCRNMSSNVKQIKELINEIKEINVDIANGVTNKLNEATEKQKKCNCITLF